MHEHDYKKMLRFMKKSLPSFIKEVSHISKPFIDNIDFLIVNFPYFKDITMVSEYFMTENSDFNRVFSAKFHSFAQILFYDPKLEIVDDVYDTISMNKFKLWEGILGRSGRDKLRRSWVRKLDQVTGDEIFTLNDQEAVYTLFFKIVNFHYKKMKKIILVHIDMRRVLDNIHLDDIFLRNILEIKQINMLSGIQGVTDLFMKYKKYDLLEMYLNNIDEEVISYFFISKATYLFLCSTDYLEYKTLYNILINLNRRIPVYTDLILKKEKYFWNDEFICSTPKYHLYISLITNNESLDESIEDTLINLFYKNRNNSFLLSNIYEYIKTNNLHEKYKDQCLQGYRNGLSEKFRPKPKIDSLYSFCIKMLNKNKLEDINYKEVNKINEYLDECYDDSFLRYICKLVIDEVPVLNIFEK
jgi:hypothetical protein